MVSKVEDQELVLRAKEGDSLAYDELVRRYSGKFFQTAFGILGSVEDAEEVVQDAFIRAYRALDKFRGDSRFDTWVYRIVVNLSRNKYQWNRRRGSEVNVSLSAQSAMNDDESQKGDMILPDKGPIPSEILESVELEGEVLKAFKSLPESLRDAMILRHVNDYSYNEIADILGCKVGTVKSRISRGRELLKKYLMESNYGQ